MAHVTGLLVGRSDSEQAEPGGVYCWRGVEAENSRSAADKVAAALLEEPELWREVAGQVAGQLRVIAEEVHELQPGETLEGSDSGYVFYVGDETSEVGVRDTDSDP